MWEGGATDLEERNVVDTMLGSLLAVLTEHTNNDHGPCSVLAGAGIRADSRW